MVGVVSIVVPPALALVAAFSGRYGSVTRVELQMGPRHLPTAPALTTHTQTTYAHTPSHTTPLPPPPHTPTHQDSTAQGDITFNNAYVAEFVMVTDFSLPGLEFFGMEYYGAP